MNLPSSSAAFADRVVPVTGAGHGLGRDYALSLASPGAAVVVNDLSRDASGQRTAESVLQEIAPGRRISGGQSRFGGRLVGPA